MLWEKRQDFKLVVTDKPGGQVEPFAEYIGWQSQGDLPRFGHREADICVVPTVAQEALGRTAVEAMASSLPVVASRLGGSPYTVVEGNDGLNRVTQTSKRRLRRKSPCCSTIPSYGGASERPEESGLRNTTPGR